MKLIDILESIIDNKKIKWILGYVDNYGKIHYKVVYIGDTEDTHKQLWPSAHHGKWRWLPEKPKHINTYNEPIDEDDMNKIWDIIDLYK